MQCLVRTQDKRSAASTGKRSIPVNQCSKVSVRPSQHKIGVFQEEEAETQQEAVDDQGDQEEFIEGDEEDEDEYEEEVSKTAESFFGLAHWGRDNFSLFR